MKAIFGLEEVSLIDKDGSPSGMKEFLCWNCPLVDQSDPGSGRLSIISETSRLLVFLIRQRVRTIAFCKVRKTCDVLLRAVRAELRQQGLDGLTTKVMSYRGGYTAQDRRKIEQAMFNGDLLGIIATNALELGIDIGSLGIHCSSNSSLLTLFQMQSLSLDFHTQFLLWYAILVLGLN